MGDRNPFLVGIEYPWIPVKCLKCNFFGHSAAYCGNIETVDPRRMTQKMGAYEGQEGCR